jgi:hypothetical protein
VRGNRFSSHFEKRSTFRWKDEIEASILQVMSVADMPITEADILEEVVDIGQAGMPADLARAIVKLRFNQTAVRRMNELAEKNGQGTLTQPERALMEKYIRVGNFLNLMQAKARQTLAATDRTHEHG